MDIRGAANRQGHTGDQAGPRHAFGDRERASTLTPQSLHQTLDIIETHAQVGFWWYDVGTEIAMVSPGLARLAGLPEQGPVAKTTLWNLIHPQDRGRNEDMEWLSSVGQPLSREFRIVRHDETVRWVTCRIDVVLDAAGRPVRFIGVMVDITARREAQLAAELSNSRRLALMDAVAPHLWFAPAAAEVPDVRPFGATWALHPEDRDAALERYRSAAMKGSVYEAAFRVRCLDGRARRVLSRGAPVRDGSGAIVEWLGITLPFHDETDGQEGAELGLGQDSSLTGAQIRGARGLLDWSLAQLSTVSGVSVSTIKRMEEGGEGIARPSKANAVRRALEAAGIRFRAAKGVTWVGL